MVNVDYLYNPEAAREGISKDYFLNEKFGFQVIEHGMVLPDKFINYKNYIGCVVDSEGKFVKSTHITHGGTFKAYTPPPNQFNIAPKQ